VNQQIILGSRGSDLALTQARMVETALRARCTDLEIVIEVIKTSGDESTNKAAGADERQIDRAGRKGLFTAEIESALIGGRIDIAVHSAKDLPSALSSGTEIAAVLPRATTYDVLVTLSRDDIRSLPQGGTLATGSVRRQHQVHWVRPDLTIVDLRGNVPTRLRKLIRNKWQGVVLAGAGLERLGLHPGSGSACFDGTQIFFSVLPPDVFVPAGGQGTIALQTRASDHHNRSLAEAITHADTAVCLKAEREFLRLLNADCNQPVGVHAMLQGDLMKVSAQVFEPGSVRPRQATVTGKPANPEKLAAEVLQQINGC
jgi:hydroxymethylbilane synthase